MCTLVQLAGHIVILVAQSVARVLASAAHRVLFCCGSSGAQ
jgi:hypothetical protein